MWLPAIFDFEAILNAMAIDIEFEPAIAGRRACETCESVGWIDERLGGVPTSGWVT